MRIAVPYENGEVFQHFGHAEAFKLYEVLVNKVVSSEIISADGSGHSALAGLLKSRSVDVLICGGIGGGAQAALTDCGIELCSGASGDADKAVESYLRGELVNSGANCDHHGEGHTCGEECGEDQCGSSCGGCAGCHTAPLIQGENAGKVCLAHYRGTFNDGTQFDSSYDRGEPLEFICGAGMMIPGFDAAVANMKVGEIRNVHLLPSEAYGESDPNAIVTFDLDKVSGAEDISVGELVYLQDRQGRPVQVKVTAKDETTITFDANHEMAGKELDFTIERVEVRER